MGDVPGNVFTKDNCEVIELPPEEEKKEEENGDTFWYTEKNKVKIHNIYFLDMLRKAGFRKFIVDQDYFFVCANNNIVDEVNFSAIKDFLKDLIMNSIQEYKDEVDKINLMLKVTEVSPSLLTKGNLEFMDRFDGEFNNDTRSMSFIYFKNCYLEVTADKYKINDYKDLDKYIWRAQIIDRDFSPQEGKSDFEEFIMKVCRLDENRFNSLRSAIGYLLHAYKDRSNTKAIIFMDEKMEDGSNGGCGKSLLGDAISRVRKSLRLDGKNFKFDRFAFQAYEPGMNIIEFNDLNKRFPFELLFSIITENIVIEKKNRDAVIIPFEYTPKILLSTNYTIKGLDESTLRRQFIIEFSDYFNMHYRPEDEFGKRFFDDWSEAEWNQFYVFMIECLQYYLCNGLVDYERVNLDRKNLMDSTSEEFMEFMEGIELNKWYGRKEIYTNFLVEYPHYNDKKFSQNIFTKWINTHAKLNNLVCELKKVQGTRYFRLRTEDFIDNEQEILF